MKIKLVRTGGIIPIKKKAETVVNWDNTEVEQLKAAVEPSVPEPGETRDGISYHIEYEGNSFSVEWSKVPAKFKATLEKLKNNLSVEK